MKTLVSILVLFGFFINGNSQNYGSYTGLVLDSNSQAPLAGAVIKVKNSSGNFEINLLTDKDGRFRIDDSLDFETVTINVSFAGFKSLQSEKVINNGFNNHDHLSVSC